MPLVKVGDSVERGQLIAKPSGLGANLHASYSGIITEVTETQIVIHPAEKQDFQRMYPFLNVLKNWKQSKQPVL